MDQLAKLAFVIAQLNTYAGDKKVINGGSTFVRCPYHTEATPSFRIFHSPSSKSPGFGKCYGCGASHPWNEFAPKLGLKGWEYAKPTALYAHSIATQSEDTEADDLVLYDLPEGKVWRSIPTDFLISIGAKKCTNKWGTAMVYLPVMVLGRERGYIKARLRKEKDKPSYINSKGSWSRNSGLFMYDYVHERWPETKTVVIVEGPRDGLRLNYKGIPTISILGTQSWSDRKTRYLEMLGVASVILCMDGDCAGREAVAKLKPKIETLLTVYEFDLTGEDSPYAQFAEEDHPTKAAKAAGVELWDPMNMPLDKLKQLKRLVKDLA